MADFGKAGKRTVRSYTPAVKVLLSQGEYLSYRLTVSGAVPEFSFSCSHRTLRSATDFPGHPKQVYEWTWGQDPSDKDADDDIYGVRMAFLTAKKYTLVVDRRRKDGSLIPPVLTDIDYESAEPTDGYQEDLHVFAA
jgi:hypothetical protein